MRLHRRDSAILASAVLIILTLRGVCASAAVPAVVVAANTNDLTALQTLSSTAATAQQRSLAAGALLALRNEDAKATAVLLPITRSAASRLVRATADVALAEVYVRDQRYRACYSAFRAAVQLSAGAISPGKRQDMADCQALAEVKPMHLTREQPGSLPITRDSVGLIRVPVEIDGRRHEAVVDTGAGFSTISASAAASARVRMLRQSLRVGTASKRALAMRLGVARQVRFGNATLTNVVFIVLPDSAMRFPDGYHVNAVIGLPVLMALGRRLEFVNSGAPTLLYDVPPGKPAGRAGSGSNMLLSGLAPLVLVHVPGALNPLPMELDTGAPSTVFDHNAVADAPILLAHAKRHVLQAVGAGGVVSEGGLLLPEVTLTIGERQFALKNVPVYPAASAISSYHIDGLIGQNVVRQGAWWVIDFKTMTLAFAKQGHVSHGP